MQKTARKATTTDIARERTWRQEADILLSMIDCLVLENQEAAYASSEFTSGRRFYALCREYGVRSKEELKKALGQEYSAKLLKPNAELAIEFARGLRRFGQDIVITPNSLEAPGWSQPEYLEFWENVICEKCHVVYFNEGWEFSNGCTFEYLVGQRAGLPLLDHSNEPIPLEEAKNMILSACLQLEDEGFRVEELRRIYQKLTSP